jgi:hypothetical protein
MICYACGKGITEFQYCVGIQTETDEMAEAGEILHPVPLGSAYELEPGFHPVCDDCGFTLDTRTGPFAPTTPEKQAACLALTSRLYTKLAGGAQWKGGAP